jgi:hypothetical protein
MGTNQILEQPNKRVALIKMLNNKVQIVSSISKNGKEKMVAFKDFSLISKQQF